MSKAQTGMIGDNIGTDYGKDVTERLTSDYAELINNIDSLLAEARQIPKRIEISDEETAGKAVALEVRLRDAQKRALALHGAEKEPYLRSGRACDDFFFTQADRCARRDRNKGKPGAADILHAIVHDRNERILAAERERLRQIHEEQERQAREAREKAEREAETARQAELAAARARKPESVAARQEDAAAAAAREAAAIADARKAEDAAYDARIASMAKPADLTRTRFETGVMSTMGQEGYAEIEDATKLDKEKLWPFISIDAKEKALRAWARNTGHMEQMPGALVGKRNKTINR